MTRLHIPHILSRVFNTDPSRLNLHLRSLGWRMMSQYPHGCMLSIQRECLSLLFPHQSAPIQQFTPSKPKTLWVRLRLTSRLELQVRTKTFFKLFLALNSPKMLWKQQISLYLNNCGSFFVLMLTKSYSDILGLLMRNSFIGNQFNYSHCFSLARGEHQLYRHWTPLIGQYLSN